MKKIQHLIGSCFLILLTSCSSDQSLQEYYVDSSQKSNFLTFDVPASILNLGEAALTPSQKEAVESLRKLNILAFKKNGDNSAAYEEEKAKVSKILQNADYSELMKMNMAYAKATVLYLGEDDAIDEVIIYGNSNEKGFAIIRVLGDDMNPAQLAQLLQAVQKSDFKGEGFEKIGEFFKG